MLNFVHEVQNMSGEIDEFDLPGVSEANKIYVVAGEKGVEDDGSPRERGLLERVRNLRDRQTTSSDTRPSL